MDELYPGWSGLADGSRYLFESIVAPYSRGVEAVWNEWDWTTQERTVERRVAPDRPLIVEGCGSVTIETRQAAALVLWLTAPAETRKSRALARDGDAYRPYWAMWAEQEEEHLARNDPASPPALTAITA